MADDNSTAELNTKEESLLEAFDAVSEQDSTEQPTEDGQSAKLDVDSKFITKTNQKLADQNKLTSYLLRGYKPQDIKERDPELAERLKRQKGYEDIFQDPEDPEDQEAILDRKLDEKLSKQKLDDAKMKAMSLLTVDGKHLGSGDIKLLKDNAEFNRRFNALVNAGYDAYEAAHESFEKAYPQHAKRVGRSILSGSSESTPYAEKPALSERELKLLRASGAKPEDVKEY